MVPGVVAVYRIGLDPGQPRVEALTRVLAPDEALRAGRFHFDRDRRRYVVARGALRSVLGSLSGTPPEAVRFVTGPHGKPALDPAHHPPADLAIGFNLSHSDDLAVVAVAPNVAVGVDIERIRVPADLDRLAARCLTPRELASLTALRATERPAAFLTTWTRKEAFAKGVGTGLALDFDDLEIDPPPAPWNLMELPLPPGYVGTLAIEGPGWRLDMRDWRL